MKVFAALLFFALLLPPQAFASIDNVDGWRAVDLGTAPSKSDIQMLEAQLPQIEAAAKKGDIDAEVKLSALLSSPESGVTKNYTAAAEWLRKAAEQGSPYAAFTLSRWYAAGEGVDKDPKQAGLWLRQAADEGYKQAETALGLASLEGLLGMKKDPAEAIKWLRLGSDHGDSQAHLVLGTLYANGQGVEKDDVQACFYLTLAANAGDKQAKDLLPHFAASLSADQKAEVGKRVAAWKPVKPSP